MIYQHKVIKTGTAVYLKLMHLNRYILLKILLLFTVYMCVCMIIVVWYWGLKEWARPNSMLGWCEKLPGNSIHLNVFYWGSTVNNIFPTKLHRVLIAWTSRHFENFWNGKQKADKQYHLVSSPYKIVPVLSQPLGIIYLSHCEQPGSL